MKKIIIAVLTLLFITPLLFVAKTKFSTATQDPYIFLSSSENGYQSGRLWQFGLNQEIKLKINSNLSGNATLTAYKIDEETILTFLVHDEQYNQLNPKLDTSQLEEDVDGQLLVDIGQEFSLPLQGNGFWLLDIQKDDLNDQIVITRSNFGTLAKSAKNDIVLWSQYFEGKDSLSQGQVRLYNLEDKISQIGQTNLDNQGIAKVTNSPQADLVIVDDGNTKSLTPLNEQYLNALTYWNTFSSYQVDNKHFLFTDRPIYKPGDMVNFKVISRRDDDARYSLPQGSVTVRSYRAWQADSIFFDKKLTFTNGAIDGQFTIPTTSKTGNYTIEVIDENKQPDQWGYISSSKIYYQVENYRKPEYIIETNSDRQEVIRGQDISLDIDGTYFSGQPLSDVTVNYKVYASQYAWRSLYYYPSNNRDYYRIWGGDEITSGTIDLDDKGRATLVLPTNKNDSLGYNQTYSVEVSYADPSGNQTLSGKNFFIKSGQFSIYQKPGSYQSYNPGQTISLPLEIHPNDDNLSLSQNLNINVYRRWYEKIIDKDKKYPQWQAQEEDIKKWQQTADSSGNLTLELLAKEEGSYIFEIELVDSLGNPIKRQFSVYVSQSKPQNSDSQSSSTLTILSQQESYDPGDSAKFFIDSSQNGDVFWSTERAYVYRYGVIKLQDGSQTLSLNIEDQDMPNTHVTVRSFDGKTLLGATSALKISTDSRKLNIRLTTDKDEYGPGDTVKVNIATEDVLGNPQSAEIALWAVDKSLFELADRNFSDIFDSFWQTRYSRTSESHSLMGIWGSGAEKGGGGDGGGRQHFVDTAYWNPRVKTDSSGRASLSFKLPDNLTTWVITTIGSTTDTKVGESLSEVKVKKDVVIRPVLPNIIRQNDKIFLNALVHNFSDQDKTFTVKLTTPDGLTIESKPSLQVDINKSDFRQVSWQVSVDDNVEGVVKLNYSLTDNTDKDLSDQVTQEIEILPYGYWQKDSQFKIGGADFSLDIPQHIDTQKSTMDLEISTSLLGSLPSAMKYLIGYPYGCVEQITSKLVPLLVAKNNPQTFSEAIEGNDVDTMVNKGLIMLRDKQSSDGGWGWWGHSDSSAFVTSYVVEILKMAKDAGYQIDNQTWQSAKDYLTNNLDKTNSIEEKISASWGLTFFDDQEIEAIDTDFNSLSPDILSLAIMTNSKAGLTSPDKLGITALLSKAVAKGNSIYWPKGNSHHYGSPSASTALAIRALSLHQNYSSQVIQAILYLSRSRSSQYWHNTFGTSQSIMAIVDFSSQLPQKIPYKVYLDNKLILSDDTTNTINIDTSTLKNNSQISIKSDSDSLYSTLSSSLWVKDNSSSLVQNGITLTRTYYNQKGENYSLSPGDIVIVNLKVSIDEEVYQNDDYSQVANYGFIQDFLPSGMVPINTRLKNESSDNTFYSGNIQYGLDNVFIPIWNLTSKTYSYQARVISAGDFKAPPAVAGLMYSPEIWARTNVDNLKIDQLSKVLWQKNPVSGPISPIVTPLTVFLVSLIFIISLFFYKKKTHVSKPKSVDSLRRLESDSGNSKSDNQSQDSGPDHKPKST